MQVINQSENLDQIFSAMCAVQQDMPSAKKSSDGYNYKYADLREVYEVSRPLLAANDLCIIQFPVNDTGLVTYLGHKSGQFICWRMDMTPKDKTPQGIGSMITYMRRYAHSAVVGISTEDDDGSQASGVVFNAEEERSMVWLGKVMAQHKVKPSLAKELAAIMHDRSPNYIKTAIERLNKTNRGGNNGTASNMEAPDAQAH